MFFFQIVCCVECDQWRSNLYLSRCTSLPVVTHEIVRFKIALLEEEGYAISHVGKGLKQCTGQILIQVCAQHGLLLFNQLSPNQTIFTMKDTDGESLSSSLGRRLSLGHPNCFDNTRDLHEDAQSTSPSNDKPRRGSKLRSVSFETDPIPTFNHLPCPTEATISNIQQIRSKSGSSVPSSIFRSKMEHPKRQTKPRMLLMGQRRHVVQVNDKDPLTWTGVASRR